MAFIIYRQTSADPARIAGSVKSLPLTNVEVDGNFKEIELDLVDKAPSASPTFTGTPLAPTAATVTNTTQIATTAYVVARIAQDASFASPTFTGTPIAPTATVGTNTTQIATTAFVNAEIANDAPTKTGGGASGTWSITATTATNATNATNVAVTDDTTTNASVYPSWVTATTGNLPTKTSSSKLSFNPSTGVLNSTTFNSTSDVNLKTNVVPLADSLSVVVQLNGVSFDWKDGSGSSYGMIAQEVEPVLPHAVSDNGTHKSINYSAVIPFLIESIKELQARIVLLENK